MRHYRWICLAVVVSLAGCSSMPRPRLPWRRGAADAEAAAAKDSAAEQFQHAQGLFDEGKYAKSIPAFQEILDSFPDSNFADISQLSIAKAQMELGQYEDAGEAFEAAVDNYPGTGLMRDIAEGQLELGDRYYKQAVAAAARPRRFQGLRSFFVPKNDFDRAAEQYEHVITTLPFSDTAASAQYRIGRAWQEKGEYEDAITGYEAVLDTYPSSTWAREAAFGLAESQFLNARPPEYDQTAVEHAMASLRYYQRTYGQDDSRDAEIQRMLDVLEDSVAAHSFAIAEWYHEQYQFASARLYYRQVVADFPETEWARRAREQLAQLPE